MGRTTDTGSVVTDTVLEYLVSTSAALHCATGFGHVAGTRRNGVLMYHGVGDRETEGGFFGSVSSERFRADLEHFAAGFEFVALADVFEGGETGQIAVTFDDGLSSVYSEVLPILREFDAPATVFVTPAFVGDRNRDLIAKRHRVDVDGPIMLTDDELAALASDPLVTVGNHTLTHPNLAEVESDERLHAEIVGARDRLEDRYDTVVDSFSYPYGTYSERAREVVETSHDVSVTTTPFPVDPPADGHALPRLRAHEPRRRLLWQLSPLGEALNKLRYGDTPDERMS